MGSFSFVCHRCFNCKKMVFRRVALLLAISELSSAAASKGVYGTVGDEIPAQYPVVNVHVPLPATNSINRAWAAEDAEEQARILAEVEGAVNAQRSVMSDTLKSLSQRLEHAKSFLKKSV